ncbi:MAG: hypothetical protein HY674_07695, partial [Chloroflexi bacterium]|nr:hypothetical protein [Chloroflexota bacterium]
MKPPDHGHCQDDIMKDKGQSALRVAFVVPSFPVISQTFVINQVADLLDRSVEVDIFSFEAGDRHHITARYAEHRMAE